MPETTWTKGDTCSFRHGSAMLRGRIVEIRPDGKAEIEAENGTTHVRNLNFLERTDAVS